MSIHDLTPRQYRQIRAKQPHLLGLKPLLTQSQVNQVVNHPARARQRLDQLFTDESSPLNVFERLMNGVKMPRILIANAGHTTWNKSIKAGEYAMIRTPGTGCTIGPYFNASILATRRTALRTDGHCSQNPAVEIYHNPANPAYERLRRLSRRGSASMCYEGPELLLYLHDQECLATILMASVKAREAYDQKLYKSIDVVRFCVVKLAHRVSVPWHVPELVKTEMHWPFASAMKYRDQIEDFKKMEPVSDPVKVKEFAAGARTLSAADRRTLVNLIEQANDGDYGIDPFDQPFDTLS